MKNKNSGKNKDVTAKYTKPKGFEQFKIFIRKFIKTIKFLIAGVVDCTLFLLGVVRFR